jgi:hypothetical protein
MCSTCCALGEVGIYCVQLFVFVTVVANRPFGGLGVEGKTLSRRVLNKCFGVVWSISMWYFKHFSKDNRPYNSPYIRQL